MDYILNSKKKSFNFKFEIAWTTLSDDNIIQLRLPFWDIVQNPHPHLAPVGRIQESKDFFRWNSERLLLTKFLATQFA